MEEIATQLLLQLLEELLEKLTKEGIKWIMKKVTDEAGRVVTQIITMVDTDGDGIEETEQVIYTLDTLMPDLSDDYFIVNDGEEIGVGFPALRPVDSFDVVPLLDDGDIISYNGEGFLIDLDGDGLIDEPVYPVPIDFTGDGEDDFFVVVDDDDNGLPDVAPTLPFYPIGSDGYYEIIGKTDDISIMDKPLDNYNVTEGLLALILLFLGLNFIRGLFTRKDVYR